MLTPCNYVHKYLGYEGDTIKDECIADLNAQLKYLGSYKVYTYASQNDFDQKKFGDESIRKYSRFLSQPINRGQHLSIKAFVKEFLLEDETALLQLG